MAGVAVPTRQFSNVRSIMGRPFSRVAVRDALYHMFGLDAKLNPLDVQRDALDVSTDHVNLLWDDDHVREQNMLNMWTV